jgi:hypothetical protein
MATTIVITCPQCTKQVKGPADLTGKKVRCKGCGETFTVPAGSKPRAQGTRPPPGKGAPKKAKGSAPPAPAPKAHEDEDSNPYTFMEEEAALAAITQGSTPKAPEAPAKKPASDDEESNPYGVTELDLAPRCPHCAQEMEDEDAIICLHCGYNTRTRTLPETKRIHYTTPMEWFLWLLPGIGCFLGVVALGGFIYWFVWGLQDMWDRWDEKMPASFSMGTRLWVSVMAIGGMWFLGKFAFKRLILNPKPPEKERHEDE